MLEKVLKEICAAAMAVLLLGCVFSSWMRSQEAIQKVAVQAQMPPAGKNSDTIPKLHLDGPLNRMDHKSDVRKILVSYEDGAGGFQAYAKLKVQGASSLDYDKKNYTIQFFTDKKYQTRKEIDLGWGEQSQYCLKANWVDKAHARNIVSARLVSEVQAKYGVLDQTPNHGVIDGFPIEVYANNRFLGLYTLNIPKDAWMLGMDRNNPNHLAFISYNWSEAAMIEELPNYGAWGIEVGKKNKENLQKFSRLFEFVMEASNEEFREYYADYFDLDAALDYVILCEFGLMVDNSVKNMILATYDGRVWYPTLYDMDSSWGSDWSGQELYYYSLASITSTSNLLKRVKRVFPQELVDRYFELRQDILTKEHVMELFYEFEGSIPADTWQKELARWKVIPGYDYDQIEEFLDERIPFLDEYMLGLLTQE